jgi:hypothetical protein
MAVDPIRPVEPRRAVSPVERVQHTPVEREQRRREREERRRRGRESAPEREGEDAGGGLDIRV